MIPYIYFWADKAATPPAYGGGHLWIYEHEAEHSTPELIMAQVREQVAHHPNAHVMLYKAEAVGHWQMLPDTWEAVEYPVHGQVEAYITVPSTEEAGE